MTPRGTTAKKLLKLPWEYPVYTPPEKSTGPTFAAPRKLALPQAEALAFIARGDPRPLLVLRECKTCNGTDDALLSRGNVDNEKTFLLSRWFHCVKLPVGVLEKDHPFHALFRDKDPEHMFLSAADGSSKIPLESSLSRVELWNAMTSVIKATYAKGPEASLRKLQKLIDSIDTVDGRVTACEAKIDALLETEGPDSPKLKKAKQELAVAVQERDELLLEIERATTELRLKVAEPVKPGSDPHKS